MKLKRILPVLLMVLLLGCLLCTTAYAAPPRGDVAGAIRKHLESTLQVRSKLW